MATYDMENGVNYLTTRLNFGLPLLVHLKCLYHHGFTKSRRIYYFDALIAILAYRIIGEVTEVSDRDGRTRGQAEDFSDMDSDRISDI